MSEPPELSAMREVVALWYVDQSTCADIVYAACDLLAADYDGPSLRMLAAVSIDDAYAEVPPLLEAALGDVGLPYLPRDSAAAELAALRAMVARALSGEITPRELTAWVHGQFGHTRLEVVELLAALDDDYDIGSVDVAEIDAEVLAEARTIADLPSSPT